MFSSNEIQKIKGKSKIKNINQIKTSSDLFKSKQLSEEIKIIKDLWDTFGVTKYYQHAFTIVVEQIKHEKLVKEFLDFEIASLKQFCNTLMVIT